MSSDVTVSKVRETVDWLKARTKRFKPAVAIIAGSGLANSLPDLENRLDIPYSRIPNFPKTSVKGHKGELVFGSFKGKGVVVMRGRFHYYEGHQMGFIAFPVRVLASLGVKTLMVTAAVGSLKPAIKPGDLLLVSDHINLMGSNPLMGNYAPFFGDMFPEMNEPYDRALRKEALAAARRLKIRAAPGVYLAVSGPSYETPAEVKAYRLFGGDVAGMSVVPEVIAARQLKMKVLGVCWVSNFTSGVAHAQFDHAKVLELGEKVSVKVKALFEAVLESGNI
ncbi:MAG: purine-nucleoside phosphorylase [Elusimicrobia bacterium]|nr:purine-nucleoside phosphorylase [Elusimicrobiota bacterium]